MQPITSTAATVTMGAFALCASAFPAARALAQGPEPAPRPELGATAHADEHEEMLRMFGVVELKLRSTDRLLYSAGAGERKLEQQQDSGIADLLKHAAAGAKAAREGIDHILELARSHAHKGGGT